MINIVLEVQGACWLEDLKYAIPYRGSSGDCPDQQKNGAKGSIESCPFEDRYKANIPFSAIGIGSTQWRRTRK
jgi:hypothetical protein